MASPLPTTAPLALLAGLLISAAVGSAAIARETSPTSLSGSKAEAAVGAWLEANRDRPNAVRAFVQRLPKGADLHSHLSGAVYAEHYLQWAAADGYCVDPATPSLVAPSACGQDAKFFPAAALPEKVAIYDKLVNLWSTRNLSFAGRSGHDQFFEAFAGFDAISSSLARQDDMVAEVANRAASQHIHHLELMLTVKDSDVRKLGRSAGWNGDFSQTRQRLQALGLADLVAKGSQNIDTLNREVAATLGCGTPQPQPGCAVTVRFLQQTVRTTSPAEVFAQLLYAFELANANPSVVGLNLVAPEDHPVALRFHIRQAVELAGASRIGHGVAVLYEDAPFQLLEEMRRRGVLVEICLTSNEVILNVANDNHPFLDYKRSGVPMALASDDEGVSRIDLSNEFQLAAQRYKLGYRDLKTLARNSLEYSFLPGASLWQAPTYQAKHPSCAADNPAAQGLSAPCSAYLAGSERAQAQWKLEGNFASFEALPTFQHRGDGRTPPPPQPRPGA
jgi:adenosine deaminase/adenosine deaminase CECR1